MNLMIIDVETGGLEADAHPMVELGAALFNVEHRALLWAYSTLLHDDRPNEAVHINGITDEARLEMARVHGALTSGGSDPLSPLWSLVVGTPITAFAAHVAGFDRAFLERHNGSDQGSDSPVAVKGRDGKPIPWICTEQDITWPKLKERRPCRHLAHLCLDHGIPVGTQHRALADVLMIVELFRQVDDLEEQVAQALKPRAVFQGQQRFEDNELAKQAGFRWDGSGDECGRAKTWWKVLPFDTPQAPTDERPFPIKLLKPL